MKIYFYNGLENGIRRQALEQYVTPLPLDSTPTQFFIAVILLRENDDVGIVLFYSVIYNF